MSELHRVKLSLGVTGVGGELEAWVCSGYRCKLERTHSSGWVGVCVSLVLVGVPVKLHVGRDVEVSTIILSVSELQCSWVCPISRELSFLCCPVFL